MQAMKEQATSPNGFSGPEADSPPRTRAATVPNVGAAASGAESLTIELAMPPRALHPNGRAHHMAKARAAKAARMSAHIRTLDALGGKPLPFTPTTINARWYFRSKRIRDDDGLTAWLKSARDGIASALGVDDSKLRMGTHTVEIDRNFPRVVVEILA